MPDASESPVSPLGQRSAGKRGQVRAGLHRRRSAHQRPEKQILSLGGPSLSPGDAALNEYLLSLTSNQRPRICFLAYSGRDHHVELFYRQFSDSACRPSHFFPPRRRAEGHDLRVHLHRQDVIYVGGGSLAGVLGNWRVNELNPVLRRAWHDGTVLCGFRAGALCWFAEALSFFEGKIRRCGGLGLLPGSGCVHYKYGHAHRAVYQSHVLGGMRSGFAIEEGVALHFEGTRLKAAVSARPDGGAFRVAARERAVVETPLSVRRLDTAQSAAVRLGQS